MKRHKSIVVLLTFFCITSCAQAEYDIEPIPSILRPTSEYVAIFGDVQYYTNSTYQHLFQYSCNWILNQKHAGININSVLHTGDCTQGNAKGLWKYYYSSIQPLAQEVPFISAIGDHDYTWTDNVYIDDRYDTRFNEFNSFPLTRQKIVTWFEEERFENIVVENYIQGLPIYYLVLEFGPRQEVVDWANAYVKSHPNINFILFNHEYLEMGGDRRTKGLKCDKRLRNTTYLKPEELWNQLIKCNDNILCVLCGHVGGLYTYTPEENDFGRIVPQIQHNIQSADYRYDNWLMLLEFPVESDSVNVSILDTKTLSYYEDKPVLFKFRYRNVHEPSTDVRKKAKVSNPQLKRTYNLSGMQVSEPKGLQIAVKQGEKFLVK